MAKAKARQVVGATLAALAVGVSLMSLGCHSTSEPDLIDTAGTIAIYGAVRTEAGHPLSGVAVRGELQLYASGQCDTGGMTLWDTTEATGAYRLHATGIPGAEMCGRVVAVPRVDSDLDSATVAIPVVRFEVETDSVKLDLTLPPAGE